MTIFVINAEMPRRGNDPITFQYVNWRQELHVYSVQPLTVEYGPYTEHGMDKTHCNQWVLHAHVLQRDGEDRPGRRTFLLSGIMEVK